MRVSSRNAHARRPSNGPRDRTPDAVPYTVRTKEHVVIHRYNNITQADVEKTFVLCLQIERNVSTRRARL